MESNLLFAGFIDGIWLNREKAGGVNGSTMIQGEYMVSTPSHGGHGHNILLLNTIEIVIKIRWCVHLIFNK